MVLLEVTPEGQTIFFVAVVMVSISTMVRRATVDMEKVKESKKKSKEQQKRLKEAQKRGDAKEMAQIQEEMLKLMNEQIKQSFKPLLITIIPFMLVFGWLRDQYGEIGDVAIVFGYGLSYLWWYLLISIPISLVINRLLKLTDSTEIPV